MSAAKTREPSWLDAIDAEVVELGKLATLEERPELYRYSANRDARREYVKTRLEILEEEVLHDSLVLIGSAMRFAEIPEGGAVPEKWIEEYGEEEAKIRAKIAGFACMSNKDAPVALKMAVTAMLGIQKARSLRDTGGTKTLNLQIVQITAPLPQFAEKEIEGE